MLPSYCAIVFKIQPIVLVFPAPFSPTKPNTAPYGNEKLMSSKRKLDPGNDLETCRNSNIFSILFVLQIEQLQ